MPAHRRVTLVGQKQHSEIGARRDRWRQHRAVHVGVAARLEEQRAPNVVVVLGHIAASLEHRRARQRRQPGGDDAQRLTRGVRVDCRDDPLEPHRSVSTATVPAASAAYTILDGPFNAQFLPGEYACNA